MIEHGPGRLLLISLPLPFSNSAGSACFFPQPGGPPIRPSIPKAWTPDTVELARLAARHDLTVPELRLRDRLMKEAREALTAAKARWEAKSAHQAVKDTGYEREECRLPHLYGPRRRKGLS